MLPPHRINIICSLKYLSSACQTPTRELNSPERRPDIQAGELEEALTVYYVLATICSSPRWSTKNILLTSEQLSRHSLQKPPCSGLWLHERGSIVVMWRFFSDLSQEPFLYVCSHSTGESWWILTPKGSVSEDGRLFTQLSLKSPVWVRPVLTSTNLKSQRPRSIKCKLSAWLTKKGGRQATTHFTGAKCHSWYVCKNNQHC